MAISQAVCNVFKQELLKGNHDFDGGSWTSASFTANGALIYRQDGGAPTNDAVVVLAFGGDFTASNGTFTVQFPTAGGGSEIIRLG